MSAIDEEICPASVQLTACGCFSDARQIKERLTEKLGAPVFLDSDDLMDLRKLQHQVTMSDVLVLFQTQNLLTRPWCD